MFLLGQKQDLAYEMLKGNAFLLRPNGKDVLFNIDWIEQYGLIFQLSICSYWVGHYQESLQACNALLAMTSVPEHWREQIKTNRDFAIAKLPAKAS